MNRPPDQLAVVWDGHPPQGPVLGFNLFPVEVSEVWGRGFGTIAEVVDEDLPAAEADRASLQQTLADKNAVKSFLDHLGKRRGKEMAQCRNGERFTVGHRKILALLIIGSAVAGAGHVVSGIETGPAIPGVLLRGVVKAGEIIHLFFSVSLQQLEQFVVSLGKTMEDLFANPDQLTRNFGHAREYIYRLIINPSKGVMTGHFLTENLSTARPSTPEPALQAMAVDSNFLFLGLVSDTDRVDGAGLMSIVELPGARWGPSSIVVLRSDESF